MYSQVSFPGHTVEEMPFDPDEKISRVIEAIITRLAGPSQLPVLSQVTHPPPHCLFMFGSSSLPLPHCIRTMGCFSVVVAIREFGSSPLARFLIIRIFLSIGR